MVDNKGVGYKNPCGLLLKDLCAPPYVRRAKDSILFFLFYAEFDRHFLEFSHGKTTNERRDARAA